MKTQQRVVALFAVLAALGGFSGTAQASGCESKVTCANGQTTVCTGSYGEQSICTFGALLDCQSSGGGYGSVDLCPPPPQ